MNFEDRVSEINELNKAFYKNAIEHISENGKIINWCTGLAGGGMILSFSNYDRHPNEFLMFTQMGLLIFIILLSILHRYMTKTYKNKAFSIIEMFDLLSLNFKVEPNNILHNDLNDTGKKIDHIYSNYINGEYFDKDDERKFKELQKKQKLRFNSNVIVSTLTIFSVLIQFVFFFIMVIN